MPLEIAQLAVGVFEAYALAGLGFAMLFLPRAVTRLDTRVAGAPRTLRLLILPGVVALWPLFASRWITSAGEPIERNPHRAKALETPLDMARGDPEALEGSGSCRRAATHAGARAMIRPLRRRHRWVIPGLFLLLVIAAVLAIAHPALSARIDALPAAIVGAATTP